MAPDRVSAGLGARGEYIVLVDWSDWIIFLGPHGQHVYTLLSPTVPYCPLRSTLLYFPVYSQDRAIPDAWGKAE